MKLKLKSYIFIKINYHSPPNLKIKMNGKLLHPSDHIKYLGIYLDETLCGKIHCEELSQKLKNDHKHHGQTTDKVKTAVQETQLLLWYLQAPPPKYNH